MLYVNEDEVARRIPRKKARVSKAKSKSDHKHTYVDCLFRTAKQKVYKGSYCTICNKIRNVDWFPTVKRDGRNVLLSDEGLLSYYSNLPVIQVEAV